MLLCWALPKISLQQHGWFILLKLHHMGLHSIFLMSAALVLLVWQVLEVLHTVAKKEKLDLPEEFAKRLVVYANRNMRR